RVRGRGVDQLHAERLKLALEGDLHAEQAAGEDRAVVREQLPGRAVGAGGGAEALPRELARKLPGAADSQQVAGVIVEHVEHPHAFIAGEADLSGVDLPQVVGQLALEAQPRLGFPRRLRGDQVVALQRPVNRRSAVATYVMLRVAAVAGNVSPALSSG